jgi:anti-sigma regulatory factor (Ser/Thr protein kinase)
VTLSVVDQIVSVQAPRPAARIRTVSDDAHRPPPGLTSISATGVQPDLNTSAEPFRERHTARPPTGEHRADSPAGAASWLVRLADLAGVRRYVLDSATLAGLDTSQAERFVLAVNEIMINAIQHADGQATVEVSANRVTAERDGDVTVTVTDSGPGFDREVTPDLPPADQLNGRGLWLVHRMCDDVVISTSPHGTIVRLRATTRHT